MCPSFLLFCALFLWSHLLSWLPCSDFSIKNGHLHSPGESFQADTPWSWWCPVVVSQHKGTGGSLAPSKNWFSGFVASAQFPSLMENVTGRFILECKNSQSAEKGWCPSSEGLSGILGGSNRVRILFPHPTSLIVKLWRRSRWFLWLCCLFSSFLLFSPSKLRFTSKLFSSFWGTLSSQFTVFWVSSKRTIIRKNFSLHHQERNLRSSKFCRDFYLRESGTLEIRFD